MFAGGLQFLHFGSNTKLEYSATCDCAVPTVSLYTSITREKVRVSKLAFATDAFTLMVCLHHSPVSFTLTLDLTLALIWGLVSLWL